MKSKGTFTDIQVDFVVGYLLRGGVSIAALIILIGGLLYLSKYGLYFPEYKVFSGEPADLRSLQGIITDVLSLKSRGIIQFGLLVLMATPVARVVFLFLAFILQKDRIYIIVSMIVLSVLIFSLSGGTLMLALLIDRSIAR